VAAKPTLDDAPLAQRMAARLCARQNEHLSHADLAKAKLCVADYLACALESQTLPWSRQAVSLTRDDSRDSAKDAGIVGTPYRARAGEAAFANAVLGHGLVRDDMHLGSVSHLGATIIPTVMALAERYPTPGIRFLAAIVAGYEAGGKLGRAVLDVDVARVFRPTGITGPFAAAAAGATLMGLDADRLTAALAMAANTAAGYNEWAATGGSEMFFHPGFAARNALTCIELARAGAYASPTALDGAAGLLAAFGKSVRSDMPLPYDGASEIQAVFFKEVPACNFAQTAAQAARDLAVEQRVAPTQVREIVARVTYAAAHYPGCDYPGPFEHILQAKMSIQYSVAAAIVHGRFTEEGYRPDMQAETVALARRVTVEIDDELTRAYPARQGAEVIVSCVGVAPRSRRLADVMPASTELVHARLQTAATARLGSAKARALLDLIDGLEARDDAGGIVRCAQTRDSR
jgi:2-methylcitrate dehydratase PrpD